MVPLFELECQTKQQQIDGDSTRLKNDQRKTTTSDNQISKINPILNGLILNQQVITESKLKTMVFPVWMGPTLPPPHFLGGWQNYSMQAGSRPQPIFFKMSVSEESKKHQRYNLCVLDALHIGQTLLITLSLYLYTITEGISTF